MTAPTYVTRLPRSGSSSLWYPTARDRLKQPLTNMGLGPDGYGMNLESPHYANGQVIRHISPYQLAQAMTAGLTLCRDSAALDVTTLGGIPAFPIAGADTTNRLSVVADPGGASRKVFLHTIKKTDTLDSSGSLRGEFKASRLPNTTFKDSGETYTFAVGVRVDAGWANLATAHEAAFLQLHEANTTGDTVSDMGGPFRLRYKSGGVGTPGNASFSFGGRSNDVSPWIPANESPLTEYYTKTGILDETWYEWVGQLTIDYRKPVSGGQGRLILTERVGGPGNPWTQVCNVSAQIGRLHQPGFALYCQDGFYGYRAMDASALAVSNAWKTQQIWVRGAIDMTILQAELDR